MLVTILLIIFGKLLPFLRHRQETLLNYGIPLALLALAASLFVGSTDRKGATIGALFQPLFIFIGFYFLVWVVKGVVTGFPTVAMLGYLRTFLGGPIIGLALAVLVVRTVERTEQKRFALQLLWVAAAIMTFQVMVSMVESRRGESFVDYGEIGMGSLEGRDVLELVGGGLGARFGFKLPFYGVLGQHNYFGSMLVGYNALWIAGFLLTRQRRFLVILAVTLFAVVGNSTRTAILCVLLMDLLIFVQLVGGANILIRFGKLLITLGAVASVILMAQQRFRDYVAVSNTLEGRLDLWASVFDDLRANVLSPIELMFGSSMENVKVIGYSWRGIEIGSLENQYLSVFCFGGATGLLLFIWSVSAPFMLLRKRSGVETRLVISGMLFAWLVSFITLDLHLHFASIIVYVATVFVLGVGADSHATGFVHSEGRTTSPPTQSGVSDGRDPVLVQ